MGDPASIRVTSIGGGSLELQPVGEEIVSDLIRRVAAELDLDASRYLLTLISSSRALRGEEAVSPLAGQTLSLIKTKIPRCSAVGPRLGDKRYKYL